MRALAILLVGACGNVTHEPDLRHDCDAGRLESCVELGYHLASGYPIKAGSDEGIQLLQRACDGGVAKGCRLLGLFLRLSSSEDVRKRGADFAKRGCDQGDGTSCKVLADDYWHGWGVVPDDKARERLLRRGCDLGRCDACLALKDFDHQDHPCRP